jgi:hypothetical protein
MTNFDKKMFGSHNEQTIVEAEASICNKKNNTKGKLVLTNCRLMFCVNGKLLHEFMLDEIKSLSINRLIWLYSNGFSLSYNDSLYKFRVQYPDDWIHLIQFQQD